MFQLPEDGYVYIVRRVEWHVIRQAVDQYGQDMDGARIEEIHPSQAPALDARQYHGYPDKYVEGRWRPHNHNGYEDLVVRRVEVVVNHI